MSDKLNGDIEKYCKLNDIKDIEKFKHKIMQQGFYVEKYGTAPIEGVKVSEPKEKIVEKIIEKVVEVPVEKIVEVIKEVPVEKIVEVEKIIEVPVTDDEALKKLLKEKDSLLTQIEEYKKIISEKESEGDSNVEVNKLKQKIRNLEIEIELEKNRNTKRKENTKPKHSNRSGFGNIINWISKDERNNEEDDVWGE